MDTAQNSTKTAKKRIGKPFSKGKSGNPGGRPKLPAEISELKKLSREDLIKSYASVALMETKNFKKFRPETVVEACIKKSFAQFMKTGDSRSLKNIWEFVLGKPSIQLPESGTVKLIFGQEEADL